MWLHLSSLAVDSEFLVICDVIRETGGRIDWKLPDANPNQDTKLETAVEFGLRATCLGEPHFPQCANWLLDSSCDA